MKDYFTSTERDAGDFEREFNGEPRERPSPDEYEGAADELPARTLERLREAQR